MLKENEGSKEQKFKWDQSKLMYNLFIEDSSRFWYYTDNYYYLEDAKTNPTIPKTNNICPKCNKRIKLD